jgi:hypothetical protein
MRTALEAASVGVAVIALLLSSVALLYTRRADKRAQRHEERLRAQDERAQKQDEREELRVQREEAEALRVRRALPHAVYVGRASLPDGRGYRFAITNSGREAASDLNTYLLDARGEVVSEDLSPQGSWIVLLMPNASENVEVVVRKEHLKSNPIFLQLTWFDESGKVERLSRVEVPRD